MLHVTNTIISLRSRSQDTKWPLPQREPAPLAHGLCPQSTRAISCRFFRVQPPCFSARYNSKGPCPSLTGGRGGLKGRGLEGREERDKRKKGFRRPSTSPLQLPFQISLRNPQSNPCTDQSNLPCHENCRNMVRRRLDSTTTVFHAQDGKDTPEISV